MGRFGLFAFLLYKRGCKFAKKMNSMRLKTGNHATAATMCRCFFLLIGLLSACNSSQQGEWVADKYEWMTIRTSDYTLWNEYPAQVKGAQDIRLIPRVEGYLEQVLVKEGQQVKKGQLLFVIDQTSYHAAVKTAEADLLQAEAQEAKARQDYNGKQLLWENHIISDFDVKQAEHDLDIAQAYTIAAQSHLNNAKNNLSFTELRSPSDGVIGTLPYRRGDYVGPSTSEGLTVVSDNRTMYVYFSLTETMVSELLSHYNSMQEAIDSMPEVVLVQGSKEYAHKGKVESISGIVDERTGAVSVRAVFANPEGRLLSGSTAKVRMAQRMDNVIVIPQEATYEILDKVFVYTMTEGRPKSHMVQVVKMNDGSNYVVTDGLKAGDTIIAKGAGLVQIDH